MVTLDDIALPVTSRSIVHFRAVESGRLIRLVGASDDRNVYRVSVRSKFAEDTSNSSQVCGPVSWSPANGPLTAYDDRLPPGSVWEIELLASPTTQGKRIEIQSEQGKEAEQIDLSRLPGSIAALACDDWNGDKVPRRNLGFAGRVRLDIGPLGGTENDDKSQLAAITTAILNAASLWVAACRECRSDHLAIVASGNELYIRSQLARWLASSEAHSAASQPKRAEEELVSQLQNYVYLNTGAVAKRLEPYVRGTLFDDSIKSFCALAPDQQVAPVTMSIYIALCQAEHLDRHARAKIAVAFRAYGSTYCGSDPEIIACRADSTLTEFNTHDYRFRLGRDTPAVGLGAIEIDFLPVLLHEMGHWIGLGHLDHGKSIMAASAERARCIDEPTIKKLMESLDPRITEPQAFRLHGVRQKRTSLH